jgi:hypothetical protein
VNVPSQSIELSNHQSRLALTAQRHGLCEFHSPLVALSAFLLFKLVKQFPTAAIEIGEYRGLPSFDAEILSFG